MITVKLSNATSFEVHSVSERYDIYTTEDWHLVMTIVNGEYDVAHYVSLLNAEGATNSIEVSSSYGAHSFDGFTEIRSIEKSIEYSRAEIRIHLSKPTNVDTRSE